MIGNYYSENCFIYSSVATFTKIYVALRPISKCDNDIVPALRPVLVCRLLPTRPRASCARQGLPDPPTEFSATLTWQGI